MLGLSKSYQEVEVMIVRRRAGAIRGILSLLFVVWGFGGLVLNVINVAEMMSKAPTGVGVGNSAFASAMALIWTGGMVLFGVGALLADSPLAVAEYRRPQDVDP